MFFVHGVYNLSPLNWFTYPDDKFIETKVNDQSLISYNWSGSLNPNHRVVYGKNFYETIFANINDGKNTTLDIYAHSHGGNLLLNSKNYKLIDHFLSECKTKNIKIHYYLFEPPILPENEKCVGKLLETYPDTIKITTYVAGNDIIQIYDLISNFPFCNRFFNFSTDFPNLEQYKVSSKNRKKINHNSTKDFYEQARNGNHLNLEKISNYDNRTLLNKLFFYHGGKIIALLIGILTFLQYKNSIKTTFQTTIKKITNFFRYSAIKMKNCINNKIQKK